MKKREKIMAFNINDFVGSNDFVASTTLPYAQWLNKSEDKFGLAIKEEQAELANFAPDDNWKLVKDVKLGKERFNMWVSQSPRLIIFNGANLLSSTDKTRVSPLFMQYLDSGKKGLFDKEIYSKAPIVNKKKTIKPFRPIYFAPISKDNKKLLSLPLVFNVQKASHRTFTDILEKDWTQSLIAEYAKAGFKLPAGQDLTAIFVAHNVFEPVLVYEEISGADNESSDACLCKSFKPIDLSKIAIARNSDISKDITTYCNTVKDYLGDVIKEKPKAQEDEIDAITDSDGVIDESSLSPEILAELDKEDSSIAVPF